MVDWILRLFSDATPPRRVQKPKRRRTVLGIERLGDRIVPAVVWTVDVTTDKGGANGQGLGNTGDLRYCCVHAASGDVINLQQVNNQTIQLNTPITLAQDNVTVNDPNNLANNVTISGQQATRLFEIDGGSATFNDLAFTAGIAISGNGGAFLVDPSDELTLNQDTFTNNTAYGTGNGGAIENDGVTNVNGCTFVSNSAAGGLGGAIDNTAYLTVASAENGTQSVFSGNSAKDGGAIESNGNGRGQLTISNTAFNNNSASTNNGGAISTNDGALLTNDSFGTGGKNVATNGNGGAVYAVAGTTGADADQLNVNHCTFASNQAPNQSGGGIWTNITTDVEQSSFTNNQSFVSGGGFFAQLQNGANDPIATYRITLNLDSFSGNSSELGGGVGVYANCGNGSFSVIVTNDTFNGNRAAGSGGGFQEYAQSNGAGTSIGATLTNDTFFQNTASNSGGGLSLSLTDSTGKNSYVGAALTSLTVTQNTGGQNSGGLYVDSALAGVVTVDNTILSQNIVSAMGYDGPVDVTLSNPGSKSLTDLGFNLVGNSDKALFSNPNMSDKVTDTPGLAATLAPNGAPPSYPQTLALQKNSLGYDNGDQGLATKPSPLNEDERGDLRQTNLLGGPPRVSIGAEDPDAAPPT